MELSQGTNLGSRLGLLLPRGPACLPSQRNGGAMYLCTVLYCTVGAQAGYLGLRIGTRCNDISTGMIDSKQVGSIEMLRRVLMFLVHIRMYN